MSDLDARFLPAPSPTGQYTSEEYDHVRAFLVLVHAEIENYLEDMAESILDATLKLWRSHQKAPHAFAALVIYDDKRCTPPKSLARQNSAETLDAILQKAIEKHREFVTRGNHGIKESNVLKLLLPLGILESVLDPVWLASMSTLGTQRGIVAHNSARRVSTPPDPLTTRSLVQAAMTGLLQLEPELVRLRRA